METILSEAQKFAKTAGQDITDQVAAIKKDGYTNAIPGKLAEAIERAGKKYGMETFLSEAQRYAKIAGQDITDQVAEIRALVKV